MLFNGGRVWTLDRQNLVPAVHVILLRQVLLGLIQVLRVHYLALERLCCEPRQKVLLEGRGRSRRWAVVQVFKLRFPDQFVAPA